MNTSDPLPRSPRLMRRDNTALLVIDVQAKLIPLIPHHERIVWNIRRLLDAADALGLPASGTEQYPQGLGPTVDELAGRLTYQSKKAFSCGECGTLFEQFRRADIANLLVAGIETHVCVQQTVLDTLAAGFSVYLAVDALGSRGHLDHEIALRRMESDGAILTTTEAALFEWCETAADPQFKRISQLIKEAPPIAL